MKSLMRLLVGFLLMAVTAGTCRLAAQQLTRKTFSDGSGSIGIAPGWHVQSAANGTVSALGPHGASIALGLTVPCVPHNVADFYPGIPAAALFPGMPRLDFTDPARAAVDLIRHTARTSSTKIENIRIKAIEPTDVPNGKAAFIRYSATYNGKVAEFFGLYEILPVNESTGAFYYSAVAAPKEAYAAQFPVMMKMWRSWSLSKSTIDKRLQEAAATLGSIDVQGITDSVMSHRREVAEKAARDFQEYVRQ
jgi:hypothetical protein